MEILEQLVDREWTGVSGEEALWKKLVGGAKTEVCLHKIQNHSQIL